MSATFTQFIEFFAIRFLFSVLHNHFERSNYIGFLYSCLLVQQILIFSVPAT